jgi:DNA processing protein
MYEDEALTIAYFLSALPRVKRKFLLQEILEHLCKEPLAINNNAFLVDVIKRYKIPKLASLKVPNLHLQCKFLPLQIITFLSPNYPCLLLHISDPPLILYALAKQELQSFAGYEGLAIVGTRNCDQVGVTDSERLATFSVSKGVSVISGLALGVDAAAHEGAIKGKNLKDFFVPTVAVLGSGFNHFYPARNRRLSEQILDHGGVLLTEYPPDMAPFPGNFLERNRIIGGLARGVVIVQAGLKSGSLATARLALNYGREVIVIPGHPKNSRYLGNLELLRDGASFLIKESELFELLPALFTKDMNSLPAQSNPTKREEVESSAVGTRLLQVIIEEGRITMALLIERIVKDLGNSLNEFTLSSLIEEVGEVALELEGAGMIMKDKEGYFVKA